MYCRRAEGVMAAVERGALPFNRDAELFIFCAAPLQVGPTAGGEKNAVSIVNGATRDLPGEGIQPRIALPPLDTILFDHPAVASQVLPIVKHLKIGCPSHQSHGACREHNGEA